MFFFEIVVPIIVYSAVIALTYFATKFVVKGIKNLIAKRRVNKELKQESKQQKSFEKQNQKAIFKNQEKAPRYNLAKGVNCLHTAENYSLIYKKKGRKYSQLKTQQSKLFEMLESDEIKNKKPITKRLQKINRKLALTTKMPAHKQEIEPDYIKEIATESGKTFQDKRTYIQCFDEKLAKVFESIAQNEIESTDQPAVAQINFNAKSKLAPLIVSSPDHKIFEEGYSLIAQKMLETIEDPENKNAFPIKVSVFEPENNKVSGKFKTLNNKTELLEFCGVENSTEK